MRYVFLNERRKLELRTESEMPGNGFELSECEYAGFCAGVDPESAEYLAWLADGNTPTPADAPPPPTLAQLLAALLTQYKADVAACRESWLTAAVTGGPTEASKKAQVALDLADLKAQYQLDVAATKANYIP